MVQDSEKAKIAADGTDCAQQTVNRADRINQDLIVLLAQQCGNLTILGRSKSVKTPACPELCITRIMPNDSAGLGRFLISSGR
jgi:hypothetical protein